MRGIIKFFNTDKGYGFLKTSEHPTDVFVHIKTAQKDKIGDLKEGDELDFDIVPGKNDGKFEAVNLSRA